MKRPKWKIQNSKDGQFYFTLQAINGEVILTSEMYTTKQAAQIGINAIKTAAPDAQVYDLT